MLDAIHDDLSAQRNHNAYVLGELGKHNVVIVVLPGIGNNHSGIAATQLLNDFPSIRIVLLVGIGGGVPSPGLQKLDSIRLGDVVVGQPTDTTGGVIQFDRGKRHDGDVFERTGCLNKPAAFVTATVEKLKATHWQGGNRIQELVSDMLSRNPHMKMAYAFPGAEQDQLFESDYSHRGSETCQQCDVSKIRLREERATSLLNVHYGVIGSSNSVIKSAVERDSLRQAHNILCVEMEAAGLMDAFSSCLVIRGICDYADSHKNKQWQPFAAAAAAAYAKELLLTIPAIQQSEPHIPTVLSSEDNSNLSKASDKDNSAALHQQNNPPVDRATYKKLLDSLTFQRMNSRRLNISRALSQTCQWLFEDETFNTWIAGDEIENHQGFLWIKSKPGGGKSTMMRTLFDVLKKDFPGDIIISYFFNARATASLEKSSIGMYRSLVLQLLQALPSVHTHFTEWFSAKVQGDAVDEWSPVELQGFLTDVLDYLGGQSIDILVDALDEGDENDVRQMVAFLEDLSSTAVSSGTSLRICLSSRHYPHISIRRGLYIVLEHREGHGKDIELYVRSKLRDDGEGNMEHLREKVCQKASSVFLWVVLVVPILNQLYDRSQFKEIEKRLEELPNTLDGLFAQILARSSEGINSSVLLLQWVLYAIRPLSPIELYLAVQSGSASERLSEMTILRGESLGRYLLNCSRGLTEITNSRPPVVQFIHESVRDFLIKNNGLAKTDLTLVDNFHGVSNERLSRACLRYFDQCLPPHQYRWWERHQVPLYKGNLPVFRSQFPFAKYAITYMFAHADIAESSSIPHLQLLRGFEDRGRLLKWVQYWNTFEKVKIRRYTDSVQLLYILSEHNLLHLARSLLEDGVEVNAIGQRYGNSLQAACAAGHVEMTKLLIEMGADVDAVGGEHAHALFASLQKKHYSIVNVLGAIGVSPPQESSMKFLSRAISELKWPVVEALLLNTTRLEGPFNIEGQFQRLHLAAKSGNVFATKLLLRTGTDINAPACFAGAPLLAAVAHGKDELARVLVESGANVNAEGGYYGNALQAAVAVNDHELTQILLKSGANVNAEGGYYGNALQAARARRHHQLAKILLESGASVDAEGG